MDAPKNTKVLVVDDNAVIRQVLRGLLRHDARFTVVGEATNGEAALELVETLRPDLVCLDVMMPGMPGLEALRAIRASYPTVRVVVVSGAATSEVVSEALKSGASGFVVKPFNAAKVMRTIDAALAAPVPQLSESALAAPVPESSESALAAPVPESSESATQAE